MGKKKYFNPDEKDPSLSKKYFPDLYTLSDAFTEVDKVACPERVPMDMSALYRLIPQLRVTLRLCLNYHLKLQCLVPSFQQINHQLFEPLRRSSTLFFFIFARTYFCKVFGQLNFWLSMNQNIYLLICANKFKDNNKNTNVGIISQTTPIILLILPSTIHQSWNYKWNCFDLSLDSGSFTF